MGPLNRRVRNRLLVGAACVVIGWFGVVTLRSGMELVLNGGTYQRQRDAVHSVLGLLLARGDDSEAMYGKRLLRSLGAEKALRPSQIADLEGMAGPRPPGEIDASARDPLAGVPLVGLPCLEGVLLGFSSGAVHFLEKSELGLGEGDPITFGAASKSPLLRMLSDV